MNVKVIATTFNDRTCRLPARGELAYPNHYQDVDGAEDNLRRLKDIVAFEQEQTPGTFLDVVIVTSGKPFKEGDEYLKSIDGMELPYGKLRTLKRDTNIGWSFGAYDAAYKAFKDEYRYWIFTEDDILVGGENYYKNLIEKYNEKEGTGFVALINVVNHTYGIHASGGVGITHTRILSELEKLCKGIPHAKTDVRQDVIMEGEVAFTNNILALGYDLVTYGNGNEWNYKKNLCVPYFNYKHP